MKRNVSGCENDCKDPIRREGEARKVTSEETEFPFSDAQKGNLS